MSDKNRGTLPRTAAPGFQNMPMRYSVANLQGIGKRERQEDSFTFVNALDEKAIRKSGMMAVVADGMGGLSFGDKASSFSISGLTDCFNSMDMDGNIPAQMLQAFLHTNEIVKSYVGGNAGSTAVVCIFFKEHLYYSSIGDSFIYLFRDRGLYRLNRLQNCLNDDYMQTIRTMSIDPSFALSGDEQAALTQYLGVEEINDIDYSKKPLPLYAGDVILLCSDGVAGVLNEEELRDCLSQSEPSNACNEIEKIIIERDGPYQDNYTALVIQCRK